MGYQLLLSNNVVAELNYELNDTIYTEIARITLVEFESRPYISVYHNHTYSDALGTTIQESYRYMGSAAQADGGLSDWHWIDDLDYYGYSNVSGDSGSYYMAWVLDDGPSKDLSAAEYEAVIAKYTEVRVIATAGSEWTE